MIIDSKNSPWYQTNKGNTGTIWSSRNLDLTSEHGKIRPSKKFLTTSRSSDGATNIQGTPVAFTRAQTTNATVLDYHWSCIAGTKVYNSSTINGQWVADVETSAPTTLDPTKADIKAFNAYSLYVASGANLYRKNSIAWSINSTAITDDMHLMETYQNRLYISGNNVIYSMNTSDVISTSSTYTFALPSGDELIRYNITCMRRVSNGIWFGTSSIGGSRAKMYFWDGTTANTAEIQKEVSSTAIIGLTILNDVPYILDGSLVLSRWNGSFFEEVSRFDSEDTKLFKFNDSFTHTRFMHPNGMQTVGNEILFNISNKPEDPTEISPIKIPSGVYAYNPEFGIYHKCSLSADDDDTITNTDVGQVYVPTAGAIYNILDDDVNDEGDEQGDFLAGFSYQSNNSTEVFAIGYNDKKGLRQPTANTAGVLITPQYLAEEVQESWQKFYTFIRPFKNGTDKIVVKYRKQEYVPVESSITWVDTTSFTSTDADWATIKTNFEAGVDYEIEGLQGDGAGYLSHVSNITETSGTYTVTLDETITGMTTNTAKVRVDRWTKFGEFTDDSEVEAFKEFNPETVSTWIQFKIYMIGQDIQLERTLSKSSVEQEI